jgi:hypothetical protein
MSLFSGFFNENNIHYLSKEDLNMSNHAEMMIVEKFYTAFASKDHTTMANCYHAAATFQDEVFSLTGTDIGAMWHMLCERGKDMTLTFSVTEENGQVTAHWEPIYTFSQTGNKVHNIIDATFEFKDGLIYRHHDKFNFWRWSKQALGLPGTLLGWTSFLQNKVKKGAMHGLQQFMANRTDYHKKN